MADFNNGARNRKLLPTKDVPLKRLVEEYLLANRDTTFINIEDMISNIQRKNYRFLRMGKRTFAKMVENAYYEYCQVGNSPENGVEVPVQEASGVDVDFQEHDPPPRPTMNNQLMGLYQSNPTSNLSRTRARSPSPTSSMWNSTSTPFNQEEIISIGVGRGRFSSREIEERRLQVEVYEGNRRGRLQTEPQPLTRRSSEMAPSTRHFSPSAQVPSPNLKTRSSPRNRNPSEESDSLLRQSDDDDLQIVEEFRAGGNAGVKTTSFTDVAATTNSEALKSNGVSVNLEFEGNSSLTCNKEPSHLTQSAVKSNTTNGVIPAAQLPSTDAAMERKPNSEAPQASTPVHHRSTDTTVTKDPAALTPSKSKPAQSAKNSAIPQELDDIAIIEAPPMETTMQSSQAATSTAMQLPKATDPHPTQPQKAFVATHQLRQGATISSRLRQGSSSIPQTRRVAGTQQPHRHPPVGSTLRTRPDAMKRKPEDEVDSTSNTSAPKKVQKEPLGRPRKREVAIQSSKFTFKDFGGSDKLLEDICKLLMHLKHPEMYRTLGVIPPRGFLLHGPPGVGKTLLAQAIAGELNLPMLKMAATELVSGISGESEGNIRDVFEQALSVAPSIIFMDEIDAITPKRENASKDMERRIVAQLLACIDDLISKPNGDQVLLIGATSRIDTIDNALRRAGRFDREICIGIPNEAAREKIIRVITTGLKLETDFDFKSLAKLTPGFVGADLQALVREAAVHAVTEILIEKDIPFSESTLTSAPAVEQEQEPMEIEVLDISNDAEPTTSSISPAPVQPKAHCSQQPHVAASTTTQHQHNWTAQSALLSASELERFCITMKDFENAHKQVQPSAKREGFATVPDTTWKDIGALADIRDELQVSILGPVKYSSAFQALGLNTPAGVLLCGPPGCGKTLLAKAVANEAGINFISVKGPELLNMYVGESERAVRQCFQRAKNSAPCVIFFDELDSLCPRRSDGIESGSSSRVVNQLLTEMDGMESRLGVFVMGATNRPDIIDPAILRPGRLDKILFVNLPTPPERVEILKAVTKNGTMPKFAEDINIEDVAFHEKCENYTGADLASLVREAGVAAFREFILTSKTNQDDQNEYKDLKIYLRHFEQAFLKTKPSVSQEDRAKYERMKEFHSVFA